MGAPDWVENVEWKEVRHKDAPDEPVWAAKVTRERTLPLTYDEEAIPFRLGAVAETNSMGHATIKPIVAPAAQPERMETRVYRGDHIIGKDGKAWAVPNIVYLYTYREVN
jgi:hypothetical protein